MGRWIIVFLMLLLGGYESYATIRAVYNNYNLSNNSQKAVVEQISNFRDETTGRMRLLGISEYYADVYFKTDTNREVIVEKMEIPKSVAEKIKNNDMIIVEYMLRSPSKINRFHGESLFHLYEFILAVMFMSIAFIAIQNGKLWEMLDKSGRN